MHVNNTAHTCYNSKLTENNNPYPTCAHYKGLLSR